MLLLTVLNPLQCVHHLACQRRQQLGILCKQLIVSFSEPRRPARPPLAAGTAATASSPSHCRHFAGTRRRDEVAAEALAGIDDLELLHEADLGGWLHALGDHLDQHICGGAAQGAVGRVHELTQQLDEPGEIGAMCRTHSERG